jgi:hypothetical protein
VLSMAYICADGPSVGSGQSSSVRPFVVLGLFVFSFVYSGVCLCRPNLVYGYIRVPGSL